MSLLFGELRVGHNITDKSHSPIVNKTVRIFSLDLMAVLFLVQPGRQSAFSAALYSVLIRNPRFLLQSCFPAGCPILYRCRELIFARGKNLAFSFFYNFTRSLPAHFCSLLKFLWMAEQLSCVSEPSSQFCIICRVVPRPSVLVIKEEVKQYCLDNL